jgi:hypothetical protein
MSPGAIAGLSESDTRAKLIDPAIHARGWTEDLIRREETSGAIDIIDGKAIKQVKGRIDYTLRVIPKPDAQPVAVALIEAKAEDKPPGHGLEQGKAYALASKRLNVQFVFSSNGHLFVEYDRHTGLTQEPLPLAKFPTPTELQARYEQGMSFALSDEAAAPLLQRYRTGEGTRRYYQDAAIRAVFEKIARCERNGEPKRALLSLAKAFVPLSYFEQLTPHHVRPGDTVVAALGDGVRPAGSGVRVIGSDVERLVVGVDPRRREPHSEAVCLDHGWPQFRGDPASAPLAIRLPCSLRRSRGCLPREQRRTSSNNPCLAWTDPEAAKRNHSPSRQPVRSGHIRRSRAHRARHRPAYRRRNH